jgi:hypothetical protein
MTTESSSYEFSVRDLDMTGFGSHSLKKETNPNQTSISLSNEDGSRTDRTTNNNTDNAWGINHRQVPLALQQNKDHYGLTFFTRPQLNLTDSNLMRERKFSRLLNESTMSIERLVRTMLDPRLQHISGGAEGQPGTDSFGKQGPVECPLVDHRQAFISFFTNNLVSLSGFPDLRAPTYSAKEGPYKEAYSFVDGPTIDYSEYDVSATFRNILGDPISKLAFFWNHYQSLVHEGVFTAYGDFIVNREIDYQTRIYRFILDPSKRYITRMACTGASYPYALSNGSFYDFDSTKPYNEASQNIQIPFKCMGAIYEDDMIVRSFNDVVSYFHPEMGGGSDTRILCEPTSEMTKIPIEHLYIFNHRGYPHINPLTYELEWYVSSEYYKSKLESFKKFSSSLFKGIGLKNIA